MFQHVRLGNNKLNEQLPITERNKDQAKKIYSKEHFSPTGNHRMERRTRQPPDSARVPPTGVSTASPSAGCDRSISSAGETDNGRQVRMLTRVANMPTLINCNNNIITDRRCWNGRSEAPGGWLCWGRMGAGGGHPPDTHILTENLHAYNPQLAKFACMASIAMIHSPLSSERRRLRSTTDPSDKGSRWRWGVSCGIQSSTGCW